MSASTSPRLVILAALDRTPASDAALQMATSMAAGIPGAELHLITVEAPLPDATAASLPSLDVVLGQARDYIDGARTRASARFTGRVTAHLAVGQPTREILQLAQDLEADFIVVGTHGKRALERMLAGSISLEIVKKAKCAVVVARGKEYEQDVPEIEPPCPQCLETQRATNGQELWCERHSRPHTPDTRLHYRVPQGFALGAMLVGSDR